MITLKRMGYYQLVETKNNTKIIYMDGNAYAWVEPKGVGEILVTSHKAHKTDCILSVGYFRLYEVQDEPKLSDQQHLELETGRNLWQGYLLPTGLPDDKKSKAKVIPTSEYITDNPKYTIVRIDAPE